MCTFKKCATILLFIYSYSTINRGPPPHLFKKETKIPLTNYPQISIHHFQITFWFISFISISNKYFFSKSLYKHAKFSYNNNFWSKIAANVYKVSPFFLLLIGDFYHQPYYFARRNWNFQVLLKYMGSIFDSWSIFIFWNEANVRGLKCTVGSCKCEGGIRGRWI